MDFLALDLIELLFDEEPDQTEEPLSNRYIESWRIYR